MKYTEEHLIEALQEYWKEHQEPPSSKKFHIHEHNYRNAFGSWNTALKEAGVPNRKEFLNVDVICPQCQKTFTKRRSDPKKFCSGSCSATFNNLKRCDDITNNCVVCGVNLTGQKRHQKYCSHVCMGQDKKDNADVIGKWLRGEDSGNYSKKVQLKRSIRTYLLEEAGHECSQCGWNKPHPDDGKVPLEIDHIDGDASNSRPENLRVLCPNCHSLTSTYKSRNIGDSKRVYK